MKEHLTKEPDCSDIVAYLESSINLLAELDEMEKKKILSRYWNNTGHGEDHLAFCCDTDYAISKLESFEEKLSAYNECQSALNNKKLIFYSDLFAERDLYFQMSTGEQNLIRLFARIFAKMEDRALKGNEHLLFIVDEIESGVHPEWSRKLIDFIVESMEKFNNDKKHFTYQFVFSTHSPFMLTDIKPGNVIVLGKGVESQKEYNTFAKNILEILNDDMFVSNIYGDFALKKIDSIIDRINMVKKNKSDSKIEDEIEMISEPLVRQKLMEMYLNKAGKIENLWHSLSLEEKEELKRRLSEDK